MLLEDLVFEGLCGVWSRGDGLVCEVVLYFGLGGRLGLSLRFGVGGQDRGFGELGD